MIQNMTIIIDTLLILIHLQSASSNKFRISILLLTIIFSHPSTLNVDEQSYSIGHL